LDLFSSPEQDMHIFKVYFNNEVLEHLLAYIMEHTQPKDQDQALLGVESYIREKSKQTFLNLYQCAYTYMELMDQGEIDALNKAFYRWYSVRAKMDSLLQRGDKEALVAYVNKERKNKYLQQLMDLYVKKNILFQKNDPKLIMMVESTYDWVMNTPLEKAKKAYHHIPVSSEERPERLFKIPKPKKSKKQKEKEVVFTIEPKPYYDMDQDDVFSIIKLRSYLVRCKTPVIDQRGGIRIQRPIEVDNPNDVAQVVELLQYVFPLYATLTRMELNSRGRAVTVQDAIATLDQNLVFYTEGELKRVMDNIMAGADEGLKRIVRDLRKRAVGICINELFPGLLKSEIVALFPDENSRLLSDMFPDVFKVDESRPVEIGAGKRKWVKGRIVDGREVGGYYEMEREEKKERSEAEKRADAEKQRAQFAKLQEHMKSIPVQEEDVPRMFLSGRLRREDRKKRVQAFYDEAKQPVRERERAILPELSKDCIAQTEGVFVRRMDNRIPERRLVHTNQYQYAHQVPYYVPTPLMKQKMCATQDIHDDAIEIEGVLYACATRDEKNQAMVPYHKFQYDAFRALQTISRENVLIHLINAQNVATKRLFQRIYAQIERDMDVDAVFIPLYELVKSIAEKLTLHQALLIFYVFVVFHNPHFQLYHNDIYNQVRAKYDSAAFRAELVHLVRNGEVTVPRLLALVSNITLPEVGDYIEKFVHYQLVHSFPYIQFEHVPFPYLSSAVSFRKILPQFVNAKGVNAADKLGVQKHACSFCKKKKVVVKTLGLPKLKEMWVCENCVEYVVNK